MMYVPVCLENADALVVGAAKLFQGKIEDTFEQEEKNHLWEVKQLSELMIGVIGVIGTDLKWT